MPSATRSTSSRLQPRLKSPRPVAREARSAGDPKRRREWKERAQPKARPCEVACRGDAKSSRVRSRTAQGRGGVPVPVQQAVVGRRCPWRAEGPLVNSESHGPCAVENPPRGALSVSPRPAARWSGSGRRPGPLPKHITLRSPGEGPALRQSLPSPSPIIFDEALYIAKYLCDTGSSQRSRP